VSGLAPGAWLSFFAARIVPGGERRRVFPVSVAHRYVELVEFVFGSAMCVVYACPCLAASARASVLTIDGFLKSLYGGRYRLKKVPGQLVFQKELFEGRRFGYDRAREAEQVPIVEATGCASELTFDLDS
jgi:hypothetical protein